MKGFGIGIVRWLVGILFGLVAAALMFGLVSRVTSFPSTTVTDGPLALLFLGFGVALFPAIFTVGTKRPRQVARRGLIGLSIEGVIALVLGAYQQITGSALVPQSLFGWLGSATEAAASFAGIFTSSLLLAILGVMIFCICMFTFIAIRSPEKAAAMTAPARAPAPTPQTGATTARPPAVAQPRPATAPPAAPPPAVAAPPKTDEEDEQLLADLENLRKRLPKMGIDEAGSGGKS